jgi:nitroreductase/NAD-dependent dihydropyrimidine dehydrogenase PreA subunit
MTLLTIDKETCARDAICVAECPAGIIAQDTAEDYPALIQGGDQYCIGCGHCVAVCPHGAMTHWLVSPSQCTPIDATLQVSSEQMSHLLKQRRSIRSFKRKPVGRDTLETLIDCARYAPSGHNLQPVQWLIIYDGSTVQAMATHVLDWMQSLIAAQSPLAEAMHLDRTVAAWEAGTDRILRGAPHVVVAFAHKDDRTAPAACTIAQTYLELMAHASGLGACWAGYFNAAANMWPPMQVALGLPKDHVSYGAMMVGHPRFKYHRIPPRRGARIQWR